MNLGLLPALHILVFFMPTMAMAANISISSQGLKTLLEAKNSKVAAAKHEISAAQAREGLLTRSFLPAFSLYGGKEAAVSGAPSSKVESVYGVEMRFNIFNGGRDSIENKIRSLETKKGNFQIQRVSAEELEKARAYYWQSVYLQEKLSLLKQTLEVNRQNLISAQRRIKSGVATDSDRFEFEMKDVDLKREVAAAEIQLRAQKRLLGILVGATEGSNLVLSEAFAHDHEYEAVLQHSEQEHEFLYKEFEIMAEQQELSARSSRRGWWPKVDAFAAHNRNIERVEATGAGVPGEVHKETVLGVRLTMNISAGLEFSREAEAQSQHALASQARAKYHKEEIEAHFHEELEELKLLHDQVHEAEQNIIRSERYYKITQSEYARGVKNSPDVLGASEKLFDMRHKRLEIIKDFQLAKSHVLSKIGQ